MSAFMHLHSLACSRLQLSVSFECKKIADDVLFRSSQRTKLARHYTTYFAELFRMSYK